MPERPAPRPGPPAPTSSPQSFLSLDFGTRRVGVATGNTLLGTAHPLRTISALGEARFAAIASLINDWQPAALVVGVPFHPDGAAHDNTRRAQRFARQLHGRFRLPVHEVDERYTTTEALAAGAPDADAAAAALILEQFLRALPPAPDPAPSHELTPGVPLEQDPAHAAA